MDETKIRSGIAGVKGPPNEAHEVATGITCLKLTQGRYTIVDSIDYGLVSGYRWCAHKAGKTFYAVTMVRDGTGNRIMLQMHRLITDAPADLEVDHWNGNGLDNRRSKNLRIATRRQNSQNQHRPRSGSTCGVSWSKARRQWGAQIQYEKTEDSFGVLRGRKRGGAGLPKGVS